MTGAIVDSAFKLHRGLGPGLLESVYEAILARDLARRGLHVERQRSPSFEYDGLIFKEAFRVDLLVEHAVVVEIKSVEKLAPVHSKQVLTYLRLLRLPVGLLINFGAPFFRDGLVRLANNHGPSAALRLCVSARQKDDGLDVSAPPRESKCLSNPAERTANLIGWTVNPPAARNISADLQAKYVRPLGLFANSPPGSTPGALTRAQRL